MIPNLAATDVKRLHDDGEVVLLDVREKYEVNHCRIEGSTHIPMGEVNERVPGELSASSRIIVYCHVGVRSTLVARMLAEMGYEDVSNLAGGIDAWSVYVDASVARY
jgi:adenylyltransferase/sulfurtransferase